MIYTGTGAILHYKKKDLTYTDTFWAFQTAKNSLGASSWLRDIEEYPGVAGYEFDRGDRIIWLV